ncbi:MAG: radical SAM family heme chaperone HemW [Candidatus Binatia bacterium]|nr:radical SAM family heme chaperone HemW [Candidatus Binatia bacterium]
MTQPSASVYLHIPWCLARCPYCDFNTYAAREWPEDEYRAALTAELAWFAERAPFNDVTVGTVFLGGGTPSLFAPDTIAALLEALNEQFPTAPDLEVTLEANPGTVDRDRLAGLRDAGVNRLSIGIQSFQPRLLEALGRRHSVDESRAALDAARAAGFENLSLDLMYATPTQTLEELEADLAEAITIAPDHVSAYALIFEPGTPLTRDLQAGKIERATDELEAQMFETVRTRLSGAGYAAYEISNHAQPGREARHNQAYWRGGPYLGVGAGAHSFSPAAAPMANDAEYGVRWQNVRDPAKYRDAVTATGHAVDEHESLTRTQAMGEFCWLALRETRGLAAAEFESRFGAALGTTFPHVADLQTEGLLEDQEARLTLSPRGLLIADTIFASFF